MTNKELAIEHTAAELRMSTSEVRTVVNTFDSKRAAIVRIKKGKKVKDEALTKAVEAQAQPKHTGGGWYLMPDGTKVKGKKAAGLA